MYNTNYGKQLIGPEGDQSFLVLGFGAKRGKGNFKKYMKKEERKERGGKKETNDHRLDSLVCRTSSAFLLLPLLGGLKHTGHTHTHTDTMKPEVCGQTDKLKHVNNKQFTNTQRLQRGTRTLKAVPV